MQFASFRRIRTRWSGASTCVGRNATIRALTETYITVYIWEDMNRTQIYLPKRLQGTLKQKARADDTTVSEVVRRAVERYLFAPPGKQRQKRGTRASNGLLAMADRVNALGVKGPKDLASNMDAYLYGGKK